MYIFIEHGRLKLYASKSEIIPWVAAKQIQLQTE